jgi:hypothetical protein
MKVLEMQVWRGINICYEGGGVDPEKVIRKNNTNLELRFVDFSRPGWIAMRAAHTGTLCMREFGTMERDNDSIGNIGENRQYWLYHLRPGNPASTKRT